MSRVRIASPVAAGAEKGESVNEFAELLSRQEPPMQGPYRRPCDSATLVLLDGPPASPRVLLGRRNERHVFMPGKFVFPGGRVDAADGRMGAVGALDRESERRLSARMTRPSHARARVFALAAIRETAEETGYLLAAIGKGKVAAPSPAWAPFAAADLFPNLGALTFVARAITPPGRPRRFDTRFFVARRRDVAAELPGIVGGDAEFVELKWLTFDEARAENLPTITKSVLGEIAVRIKAEFSPRLPVPFYFPRRGRMMREEIA